MVRIVILGDSFVFGYGVAAEDRLGAHLETWLRERTPGFEGRIECLHLGIPSWNIQAESAYLRRQLSDLRPDLVIHIIVPNDIDDSAGTRGFGAAASFSTQHRERADMRITAGFPKRVLGINQVGFLRLGLDYESRSRYAAAAEDIAAWSEPSSAPAPGIGSWSTTVRCYRSSGTGSPADSIPTRWSICRRPSSLTGVTWCADTPHWNREGHALVARMIYGLITRDELLPRLSPPAWEEASAAVAEIAVAGRRRAERELDDEGTLAIYRSPSIAASLDFTDIDAATAAQIHGGLDKQGRVSPYASFLLRNDGGKRLQIDGHTFPGPELDGARVRVFVDAEKVGEFEIQADGELALTYRLPAAAADLFLSLRAFRSGRLRLPGI